MGNQSIFFCCQNTQQSKQNELFTGRAQQQGQVNEEQTGHQPDHQYNRRQVSLNEARSVQTSHSRMTSNNSITSFDSWGSMPNFLEDKKRIQKLEEVVHFAKTCQLKVISGALQKGIVLNINAQGLEGSLRNSKDGVSYFGCKKRSRQTNPYYKEQEIINDFIIPQADKELANRHRGRHFLIYYSIKDDSYKLRDLGVGFGSFVRIDGLLSLKDNHMVHLGESFIVINLMAEKGVQKIKIKVFGGPSTGDVQQVLQKYSTFKEQKIKIGRQKECNVILEDNLISKIQCSIDFINGKWKITDGDIDQGRKSTNGTWLYANEDFSIYNGLVFKANQTLFEALIN